MTLWRGPFRKRKAYNLVERIRHQPLSVRAEFVERTLLQASGVPASGGERVFPEQAMACAAIVAASLPHGRYLASWGADLLPAPAFSLAPLAYHTLVRVARAYGFWSNTASVPDDYASTTVGNVGGALATTLMASHRRWPVLVRCSGMVELFKVLSHLRPRDCEFTFVEIDRAATAGPVLHRLTMAQRMTVGVAAAPILAGALDDALAGDPWARPVVDYLRGGFPPDRPVPVLESSWLAPLVELAQGDPGEPVTHGLYPSTINKLARVVLARNGYYSATTVINAVEVAYQQKQPYHAHDAVACAVVHPEIDAGPLVDRHVRNPVRRAGKRARRKRNRLVTWAVTNGYLNPR